MKKYLYLILVVMLLVGITTSNAEVVFQRSQDARVSTWAVANDAGELSTTITTNNRIFGYTYTDSSAGEVGLYDASTLAATITVSEMISEVDCAAGTAVTVMFPLPRNLSNGLVVRQKNTTGCATVYYE